MFCSQQFLYYSYLFFLFPCSAGRKCIRFLDVANDTLTSFDGTWWSGNSKMKASQSYPKTLGSAVSWSD